MRKPTPPILRKQTRSTDIGSPLEDHRLYLQFFLYNFLSLISKSSIVTAALSLKRSWYNSKPSFCSPPFFNCCHSPNDCFIYISNNHFWVLPFCQFPPHGYSCTEALGLCVEINVIQLKEFVNIIILQLALICLCCPTTCHFNSNFIL